MIFMWRYQLSFKRINLHRDRSNGKIEYSQRDGLILQLNDQVAIVNMRRVVDILVSTLVILINLPLIVPIVIAIKLNSKGPILAHDTRVGRWRKAGVHNSPSDLETFTLYHFRIARHEDEINRSRFIDKKQITLIGRFLQKTSLDLLPEFFNVLKGDLSLIGPRPITPDILKRDYDPAYALRFTVRPGVTGWWQVTRGHLGTLEEMFDADLKYIQNNSIRSDIRILLMTPMTIVERSNIQHWLNSSVVTVRENYFYNFLKRLFDIVFAAIALVVLSPLLVVIAILIYFDSPGPIIFKQLRTGKRIFTFALDNHPTLITTSFNIYKFRTMYDNPALNNATHKKWVEDWASGKLGNEDNPQEIVKPESDARVTRVGRILRATSLDELPQLINVLRGDMSLVGPRPVPLYETEAYKTDQLARLDAVPGITGWWQINLRGRGTLDQMVELDMEYIRKRSLVMDLKIMLMTVPAVITGRGAK